MLVLLNVTMKLSNVSKKIKEPSNVTMVHMIIYDVRTVQCNDETTQCE